MISVSFALHVIFKQFYYKKISGRCRKSLPLSRSELIITFDFLSMFFETITNRNMFIVFITVQMDNRMLRRPKINVNGCKNSMMVYKRMCLFHITGYNCCLYLKYEEYFSSSSSLFAPYSISF